jgi:hypothetical protein
MQATMVRKMLEKQKTGSAACIAPQHSTHLLHALATPRRLRLQAAGICLPHLPIVLIRLQLIASKVPLQQLRHYLRSMPF